MAEYKYQPIDLDRPATRFLRLFSGKLADEIQCDLFQGRINQSEGGMPYEALSYTWGSTEKAARIIVNGSAIHVTLNLHTALQHLRFEDTDRILWIDAICINQADIQERNQQIQQMDRIYREAEYVVIWLGEGTEESDLIMDAMKRLQENKVKVEGDWRRSAQLWMHPQPGLRDINLHEYAKLRGGMELILKRPWFRRIWILQEVANARVATIHCGKKSISARTFAQVPSIIRLQPESRYQAVLDIMPGLSRKESWWGQNRNLHTLLVKFRESEATDDRDKIYTLLGISSDACRSDILLPDYTKSLEQVIRDTTLFLLSHTDQDRSLYKFLHWTLPEFLQSLNSLSSAVLGSASENGQEALIKLLLSTNSVELDWKCKEGQTPLQRAACHGHETVVQLLLEKGAAIDSKDKENMTPLSRAAGTGHKAIVQLLLDQGADVMAATSKGGTPLHWASRNGHLAVVQLLLDQGADAKAATSNGETPLHWVSAKGHLAVVQLLLDQGADAKAATSNGETPLHWASTKGQLAVVQLLLDQGADAKAATSDGETPLQWASEKRHTDVVKLLFNKVEGR